MSLEGKVLEVKEFLGLGLRRTCHKFHNMSIYSKDKPKQKPDLYLVEELGEKGFKVHYQFLEGTVYNPQDDYKR